MGVHDKGLCLALEDLRLARVLLDELKTIYYIRMLLVEKPIYKNLTQAIISPSLIRYMFQSCFLCANNKSST